MNKKMIHMVAFILLIIGGLNWLLYAFDESYNLVGMIFGSMPVVEKVIYILIGLSAVYELVSHKAQCRACRSGAHTDVTHG
jgi:hypothetical protein